MKKLIKGLIIIVTTTVLLLTIAYEEKTNPKIKIYDTNNNEIAYLINNNKTNSVDSSLIDNKTLNLLINIEDEDFYKHKGFSIKRIMKALLTGKTGASTITQQLVKNTYLDNKRLITRKFKELILARKLERKLTKKEILDDYLAVIYFGNGIYGIKNASSYYFSKEYYEITENEMLALVALLNAPSIYEADITKWNNKKNIYANSLYNRGLINQEEYQRLLEPISLQINENYYNSNRYYYIDMVMKELKDIKIKASFPDVIKVYTDYTPKLESLTTDLNTSFSLFAVNKEGYIITSIGNKSYKNSSFHIGEYGLRDIGSTIKPLLYYELIKCNLEDTKFVSEPFSYRYKDKIYTVTNNNNKYYGNITLNEAVAVSDNIYALKSHLLLGTNTLKYHLEKYNLKHEANPALALGAIPMSLHKLTDIYTQFFTDGKYLKTRYIKKIKTKNDEITLKVKTKEINDKKICLKVRKLLEEPFNPNNQNATCYSISKLIKPKVYGKTGLTDYDSYIIGFTDSYLISIWAGNLEGNELTNINIKKLPKKLFSIAINKIS